MSDTPQHPETAEERYRKVVDRRRCAFCHANNTGRFFRLDNSECDVLFMMHERRKAGDRPWSTQLISRLLSGLTYLCGRCEPPATDCRALRQATKTSTAKYAPKTITSDAQTLRGKVRAIRAQAKKCTGQERNQLLCIALKYERRLKALSDLEAPVDDGAWVDAQTDALLVWVEQDHTPWFGQFEPEDYPDAVEAKE